MAAYQCFCTAPLSPLRRAIAVCSAAAHSASRRCSEASATALTSDGRRGQLPVLHPHPAEQQSVPVGEEGLVGGVQLAAGAHGPADHAAGAHRVAAVQRGQRHQRGGRVRRDARRLLFGGDRLAQPRDGDRERLIQ